MAYGVFPEVVAAQVMLMLGSGFCWRNHSQLIENNIMKYSVHVPLGKPLQFPNLCPFTDTASPNSIIRLKRTATTMVLPLPGFILSRNTTTSMCFPASRKFALRSLRLQVMIWVSLLGGIGICIAWLSTLKASDSGKVPLLVLAGGVLAAIGFRVARYWVLRPVRIKSAWNEFVEVRFRSERYAKAFAELNRLAISAD